MSENKVNERLLNFINGKVGAERPGQDSAEFRNFLVAPNESVNDGQARAAPTW